MYGLLNRAIQELVTIRAGRSGWEAVCERAGVGAVGFASMRAYPDELTYDLVDAASQVLERRPSEVLRALGRFWIPFTRSEGFVALLESSGRDLRDLLMNLDALHSRLALTMPEMIPPRFVVEDRPEGVIHVHYYSDREGLSPLVVGLLEGLGELFETPIHVSQVKERETPEDCDVFAVVPKKRDVPT